MRTPAAMADMLSEKLEKQAVDNKMETEEKAELKDLADKDLVNEDSKAAMADMLSEKLEKQAVDNKMETEEKAELNDLADKDLVNEDSKAAMAENLAKIQAAKDIAFGYQLG